MHRQHLRIRRGDNVSHCLCDDCFAKKCNAYENLIVQVQKDYLFFKAYVEHQRGNIQVSHAQQQEAHRVGRGTYSHYALPGIRNDNNGMPIDSDYDVINELQNYLLANNTKFKDLDTYEIQRMMWSSNRPNGRHGPQLDLSEFLG